MKKETTLNINNEKIKVVYNGLKVNWELVKGRWHFENYDGKVYINFYADWYSRLPWIIQKICNVKNDSDSYTDYFDKDSFKILQDHILFTPAAAACIQILERRINQTEKNKRLTFHYKNERIEEYKNKIQFIKNFTPNL